MTPYDLSAGNRLAVLRVGFIGKQSTGANPYTGKRPLRSNRERAIDAPKAGTVVPNAGTEETCPTCHGRGTVVRVGLAHVLRDAGFVQVHTEAGPTYPLTLCDHDLGRPEHREVPMHVFGRAQCP